MTRGLVGSAQVRELAPQLVILGERQAGKTHLMMLAAVGEAAMGGTVWYTGHNRRYEQVCFQDCLDVAQMLFEDKVLRVYRAKGKARITFHGGGVIHFGVPDYHGPLIDLHCIDDNENADRFPCAYRSIKSVTL
jgi:hypothetical protein